MLIFLYNAAQKLDTENKLERKKKKEIALVQCNWPKILSMRCHVNCM